jgi:hypothetical protein
MVAAMTAGIVANVSAATTKTSTLDIPVADGAKYGPPRRGCDISPASARVAASTTATVPSKGPKPVVLGHCRVLEIGDSLGDDLGWGLARELDDTPGLKLIQRDRSSTGLSASWFYNWPRHLKKYLRDYRPHLVIVLFGANDEQALAVHGVSQPFGSPQWRLAYTARVRQIDALATKAHSYVLWVGVPIAEPVHYRRGLEALNAIYQKAALDTPGVTYQPTWNLLSTPSGQYRGGAIVNGTSSALRASDGIHLTDTGELVVATFIARQIATIYNVKVHPLVPAYIDLRNGTPDRD